jgi:hypothetical protein
MSRSPEQTRSTKIYFSFNADGGCLKTTLMASLAALASAIPGVEVRGIDTDVLPGDVDEQGKVSDARKGISFAGMLRNAGVKMAVLPLPDLTAPDGDVMEVRRRARAFVNGLLRVCGEADFVFIDVGAQNAAVVQQLLMDMQAFSNGFPGFTSVTPVVDDASSISAATSNLLTIWDLRDWLSNSGFDPNLVRVVTCYSKMGSVHEGRRRIGVSQAGSHLCQLMERAESEGWLTEMHAPIIRTEHVMSMLDKASIDPVTATRLAMEVDAEDSQLEKRLREIGYGDEDLEFLNLDLDQVRNFADAVRLAAARIGLPEAISTIPALPRRVSYNASRPTRLEERLSALATKGA